MEKDTVIKLRNALKCGKNLPIRVLINNSFTIIDENHKLQFTKWDDENGLLYSFRLVDPASDRYPNNKNKMISFFVVSYNTIEAIEVPLLPLSELDNICDSLESINCPEISADFRGLMKNTFNDILSDDRVNLYPSDINTLLGPNSVNDKDDYYNSKYTENYQETKRYKKYNDDITNS